LVANSHVLHCCCSSWKSIQNRNNLFCRSFRGTKTLWCKAECCLCVLPSCGGVLMGGEEVGDTYTPTESDSQCEGDDG
ncbi:unnamed protein product, partial [Sphagnum balticum]